MSNYSGYPGSGGMNPQPPPPSFQPPKASPSHPSQLSVRGSPSHPSQLQSVRSSPSHPSQLQSVRSSPSHPSQLQPPVRNSPSHPSQLPTVRSSPSHPSQMQIPVGAIGPVGSSGALSHAESEDQLKLRFQVEMEFVQSLGNPNYLHFLAQRGYLKDPCFVNYLKYLQYWQEPQYVKYLKYPVCLHMLELLQHETLRKEIVSGECARFLDDQLLLHWQHYSRKRAKLFDSAATAAGPQPTENQTK